MLPTFACLRLGAYFINKQTTIKTIQGELMNNAIKKNAISVVMAAAAVVVLHGGEHSTRALANQDEVAVIRVSSIRYRCSDGEQLQATYYSLRDRSLSFVRLQLPDGRLLTLPQLVSANGQRFSTDRDFTWWSTGQGSFLKNRDSKGEWRISLQNCDPES